MKLYELFTEENENKTIIVIDRNGNELDRYDGKNSIDESYNARKLVNVVECGGTITATI